MLSPKKKCKRKRHRGGEGVSVSEGLTGPNNKIDSQAGSSSISVEEEDRDSPQIQAMQHCLELCIPPQILSRTEAANVARTGYAVADPSLEGSEDVALIQTGSADLSELYYVSETAWLTPRGKKIIASFDLVLCEENGGRERDHHIQIMVLCVECLNVQPPALDVIDKVVQARIASERGYPGGGRTEMVSEASFWRATNDFWVEAQNRIRPDLKPTAPWFAKLSDGDVERAIANHAPSYSAEKRMVQNKAKKLYRAEKGATL